MNTWGVIKQLCSGKLIASTSLWIFVVPAIVKITNAGGGISVSGVDLVTPQSIIYLYFSAIAFFISHMLYIVSCPNIVKLVNHYTDFCSLGLTVFDLSNSTRAEEEKTAKELVAKIKGEVNSSTTKDINSTDKKNLTLTVGSNKIPQAFTFNEEDMPIVFNFVYNFNLSRMCFMQFLCWVFLSIGFALLAFLLISNLVIVVGSLSFP